MSFALFTTANRSTAGTVRMVRLATAGLALSLAGGFVPLLADAHAAGAASAADCWVPGSVGHALAHQTFRNASIADAGLAEVGLTCATGSGAPGECVMAVMRWVAKAGGVWDNTGRPDTLYSASGATRVSNPAQDAIRGDIVQYVSNTYPGGWVTGVHTYVIVTNHHDGSYDIVQSNVPSGSGHVTSVVGARINPPGGFHAEVWRMGSSAYSYSVISKAYERADGTPMPDPSHFWLGETGRLSVTVQNVGTQTWGANGVAIRIGPSNPTDQATNPLDTTGWLSPARSAQLPAGQTVAPGGRYTFTFPFVANIGRSYTQQFNLVAEGVTWFGQDPALVFTFPIETTVDRGIALRHHGTGGYTLAPDGTVSPFGGAPALTGTGTPTWPDWDIARGIVLRADDLGGYVLDGWGGIHPFGNAPALATSVYWSGWDIARGIVLRGDNQGGYVLDGYGGIHPFGNAPALATSVYWSGWDIAKAVGSTLSAGTWDVDGAGGIHPIS